MKKLFIKKLEDMPAWFSNDNYTIFDDFSLEDLYREIQSRISIDLAIDFFVENSNESDYKSIEEHGAFEWRAYKSILSGSPMLSKLSYDNGENFECFSLTDHLIDGQLSSYYQYGVRMMGAGELRHLNGRLEEKCGPSEYVDDFNMELLDFRKYHLPLAHLLGEDDISRSSQVPIVLDLASFTDKEIVAGVKDLLSNIRKQLSIATPDKNRVWEADRNKILERKVLQILDLRLWEKYEGTKIKKSVLIVALYPSGEIGESDFDATVNPFIKKLTSDNVILPLKI
ncbi:DUF6387 family protein [Alteromonas antoniana]|uniref:DUF6387 family protein n=1 Tax=Alteromonas antoniana TaxID=2803813 RepID=UPI001C461493|nr:DUF6387 family protein [Alteromonas antoniana]